MAKSVRVLLAIVLSTSLLSPSIAGDVEVQTVLNELADPRDVAIRPGGSAETFELFAADGRAGRVIKISSAAPHRRQDVITGFPPEDSGEEPAAEGLHRLLFLDERKLIVGTGGSPPEVRLYELAEPNTLLDASHAKQTVGPELQTDALSPIRGRCIALARTRANEFVADMLLAAFDGDEGLTGVSKLPVRAGILGSLSALEEPSSERGGKPTAITVSEQGYLLIAEVPSDSGPTKLVFVNPASGQRILSLPTSLTRITSLAYSAKSGNLYALATAGAGEEDYCVFRMDDASEPGKPGLNEVRIVGLKRPTALAFGPDGALYVTSLGEDEDKEDNGALLKVTGDL